MKPAPPVTRNLTHCVAASSSCVLQICDGFGGDALAAEFEIERFNRNPALVIQPVQRAEDSHEIVIPGARVPAIHLVDMNVPDMSKYLSISSSCGSVSSSALWLSNMVCTAGLSISPHHRRSFFQRVDHVALRMRQRFHQNGDAACFAHAAQRRQGRR